MSMDIENLDSRFAILARQAPASVADLDAALGRFPGMPDEYVKLCKQITEVELDFEDIYLRVWAPSRVSDQDDGYGFSRKLEGAIPIGDNGGGTVLIYYPGKAGFGIYTVRYGAIFPENARFLVRSLEGLLTSGTGMDRLR